MVNKTKEAGRAGYGTTELGIIMRVISITDAAGQDGASGRLLSSSLLCWFTSGFHFQ